MKKYPEPKDRADFLLHEPLKMFTVPYTAMTIGERKWLRKRQKQLLSDGDITQEQYEELIKEYPLPEDKE